MKRRIEADNFLIAQSPSLKGPTALLCQLQRLDATSSTRLHTPAYDLRRCSNVLDPKEAIVTSYEDEKVAIFKSPRSKLVRKVSSARRSQSASPCTPPRAQHSQRSKAPSSQSIHCGDDQSCGTLRVFYKPGSEGRDWRIVQSSAGFTFSTTLATGNDNASFVLVWTHRYKPQRKASVASVLTAQREGYRSTSPSGSGKASISAGICNKRRTSLPGLVLDMSDEWECRLVDPAKAASGSRGLKIARLTMDELILYHLPTRSTSKTTTQSDDSVSSSGMVGSQPTNISRTVTMSALWILTHPHELYVMHGLGSTPDWLRRPASMIRSPSALSSTRSTLYDQQSLATPSTLQTHSAPVSRAMSARTSSSEASSDCARRGRGRSSSTASNATSVSSVRKDSSPTVPNTGRATTMRPTCYSFLNSFKLWKPRSQRQ